jgi:hypothetical protein
MPRDLKSFKGPPRSKSTRNGAKTFKQNALEDAAKNKRATKQQAPQRAPSVEPINPPVEEHQSSPSRESTPGEPVFDVSTVKYELNIACFLDKNMVITRVKHLTLGEYKLQPFLADTIKTIAQRAENNADRIKWDNGRAELRHKGLRKQSDYSKNDVFDDGDWEEVENALRAWMLRKASDIRVDLHLNFKTIQQEAIPDQNKTPSTGGNMNTTAPTTGVTLNLNDDLFLASNRHHRVPGKHGSAPKE